jgi:hypothetical protein
MKPPKAFKTPFLRSSSVNGMGSAKVQFSKQLPRRIYF